MPDPALDAVLADAVWLRRLARSLVRDAHRAEDAVQDTLAKAVEHGAAPSSPRAWLRSVLRNTLRQDARSRARREFHETRREPARPGLAPDAVNERLELQRLLLEAVRTLEEPYRSAIVARFFDGLAPREIARRDALPVKTVNTRLERGLAKLRARLDGKFGGERTAWLQALVPFAAPAAGAPWSLLGEGLVMGTMAKVAAGVVTVLAGIWLGRLVLEPALAPEARTGSGPGRVERERAVAAEDGSARAEEALQPASDELVASTGATSAARSDVAPPPLPAPSALAGNAVLSVRVVKRISREAPKLANLLVTDASPEGERASDLFEGREHPLAQAEAGGSGAAKLTVPAGRPLWVSVDPGRWERPPQGGEMPLELLQRTTVPVEPLAPGEERPLVIEIQHGTDLVFAGQVVAAEDGRALPGARIEPSQPFAAPGTADEGGYFAVPYASWDPPPFVLVSHEGYTPKQLQPRWIDQVPGLPVVVALERAGVIEARIDAAGRAGLELRATEQELDLGASYVELDGRGWAELAVPAGLPLILDLRTKEGELLWRDPEPWKLAPGERRELALRLGTGTLVYGWLRADSGAPIPEQELWALAAEEGEDVEEERESYLLAERKSALIARTDAGGRFEFAELPSGAWWIGPAPPGPWLEEREKDPALVAPFGVGVTLLPGEPSRRVDLTGYRDLWIEGRVEGEDGRALPQAIVYWGRMPHGDEGSTMADERGEFLLGPLAPAEHGLRAIGGDGVFGWPGERTVVRAGAKGVVLVLSARNSIGGRVVDREGRAQDAHVHLLQRNGSLGQETSEGEQGAFRFIALEPGAYTVQAEAPDGRVAVRNVALEEGGRVLDVVLTLAEGTRIGVRHGFARGVRCAIWAGDALAADSTVSPGEESFETVPAGPLRVELYSGDEVFAVRELVGRAGRVESVAFE